MISYAFELIIAVVISWYVYSWKWWAVSISFPLIMSISNFMYDKPSKKTKYRRKVDTIIMITQIGYIISQIIIFQIHLGEWYGWLIGCLLGYLLMGWMAPNRWEYEI